MFDFILLVQRVVDIKNRPRIPIPDEDPYSIAGNGSGSSGSSGFNGNVAAAREQLLLQTQQHAQRRSEKPPKLPPRENMYPHDIPKVKINKISSINLNSSYLSINIKSFFVLNLKEKTI